MSTPIPLSQAGPEPDWLANILKRHSRTGAFAQRLTHEACAPDAPCQDRILRFILQKAQDAVGGSPEPSRCRGVAAFFTILDLFGKHSMVQSDMHFVCEARCPGIEPSGIGRRIALMRVAQEIVRPNDGNRLKIEAAPDGILVKFEGSPRVQQHFALEALKKRELRRKVAEFAYLAARILCRQEEQLWKPGISIEGDEVAWADLYEALTQD